MIGDWIRSGEGGRYSRTLEVCAYGLAFAVVAAIGAANLFYPFGPDQAVIFDGAKRMDLGAIYYAGYWDNKQPGLYWFYLLAGRLFGFSESGIHLLELVYLLAFAAVAMAALRNAFKLPWLSAVVPVATIGVYYGSATEFELTQLEFLVSFPLFVFILCLLAAHRRPRAMAGLYFLSGLLSGIAVLFKLVLAPLCVGLWLVALAYHFRERGVGLLALFLRGVLPASLGVVFVLGGVVLLYAHWGHLDALIWTSFVYPPEALAVVRHASKTRLVTAFAFFISGFAPWAIFAIFAVIAWAWRQRDLLGALMLAWLVIGVALFLVQRFSWWHYHTLLILFPAGFFAVAGIDRIYAWLSQVPAVPASRASLVAGLLAVTAGAPLAEDFIHKAQPLLSSVVVSGKGVRSYQALPKFSSYYANCLRAARFLRSPEALPGPIYVFGSAIVYEFSGRVSPHPTNGWSWEYYLPEQIDDILMTLERQQVPYVFVGREGHYTNRDPLSLFRTRPKIARFLRDHYVLAHEGPGGAWYRWGGLAGSGS